MGGCTFNFLKKVFFWNTLMIIWVNMVFRKCKTEIPLRYALGKPSNTKFPVFYKVYKRPLTPPRFIKLRSEFFENTFTTFFHWIWFHNIQNKFYFIMKRLKNSFLICFRRPFLCQFHVAKALQNIQNSHDKFL